MAKTTNIWIAAADNDEAYVKNAIESGAHTPNDKDANGYTPIHAAASYGHTELLRYLISKGGNINIIDEDGDTPLHSVEDADVAKFLVEEFSADWRKKNSAGQTPLDKLLEDDEDEFPELISYFQELAGTPSSSAGSSSEFVPKVEYQTMDEDQGPVDLENRRKIEEIMQSENPEEGLRSFMEDVVKSQFGGEEQDSDRKRTKTNN